MGGASSKVSGAGAAAARTARSMPQSRRAPSAEQPSSALGAPGEGGPNFPGDQDLLTKFNPQKVVEMSRSNAQAAAKKMYEGQVPDMDPEILRKAIELGPAGKSELSHQKLVPDESERVVSKIPRPLPKDRTRLIAVSGEVDETKGLLTQTQLNDLLQRVGQSMDASSPELAKSVAADFHISQDTASLLLRYYRAPDVRRHADVMTARWSWPSNDRPGLKASRS